MQCKICGADTTGSPYEHMGLCYRKQCFSINYWNERVEQQKNNDPNLVVINGVVYQIGDENSKSTFRGYDGRPFEIEYFDGRKVTTTNLWYNGGIPDMFKNKIVNNARFVDHNKTEEVPEEEWPEWLKQN